MWGVRLFLEERQRVGLNRLMFERRCCLFCGGWELGIIRNVFDPEFGALSVGSEDTRRDVGVLTAWTACLSDEKPVDFVAS